MAVLELVWRDCPPGSEAGRRFLDFVVDGGSLSDGFGTGLVSCLGSFGPEHDELSAARLLRKAPPDAGDRVAIYVCPGCGATDHECGAISVRVVREGDAIVWRDIAFTNQDGDAFDHAPMDRPELRFQAHAYWAAITNRPRP